MLLYIYYKIVFFQINIHIDCNVIQFSYVQPLTTRLVLYYYYEFFFPFKHPVNIIKLYGKHFLPIGIQISFTSRLVMQKRYKDRFYDIFQIINIITVISYSKNKRKPKYCTMSKE